MFNSGIRKTLRVRKSWKEDAIRMSHKLNNPVVFHCASLGEFDQALPVIQAFRKTFPGQDILISFFSPSGYEKVHVKYPEWDLLYLPLDTPGNMREWVRILQPCMVFFARYEFWPNLLASLKKAGIDYVFFSSVFRPGTPMFSPWMGFLRQLVLSSRVIFVQDERSESLLRKYPGTKVVRAGDTRIDRVYDNILKACDDPVLIRWAEGEKLLILGSVHREDLTMVEGCIEWSAEHQFRVLLAPHDVDENSINWWMEKLSKSDTGKWSAADTHTQVLILDTIGLLANAYALGDMAYIGGGFGKSIHNTLEPAAAGIPIAFGPRHERFVEAMMLIETGAAFPVHNLYDLKTWLRQMANEEDRLQAGKSAAAFIAGQRGAAQTIIDYLVAESMFK